eukprot:6181351-Pleurochrysis_carterae.AAC.4
MPKAVPRFRMSAIDCTYARYIGRNLQAKNSAAQRGQPSIHLNRIRRSLCSINLLTKLPGQINPYVLEMDLQSLFAQLEAQNVLAGISWHLNPNCQGQKTLCKAKSRLFAVHCACVDPRAHLSLIC